MLVPGDRVADYPLRVGDSIVSVTAVNTGSTHAVVFVDSLPEDEEFFALFSALAALWLVRKRTAPRTFAAYRPPETAAHRRRVRWAQLAGILGSAIRIGTSPQARSLWHNLRARRRRRY